MGKAAISKFIESINGYESAKKDKVIPKIQKSFGISYENAEKAYRIWRNEYIKPKVKVDLGTKGRTFSVGYR